MGLPNEALHIGGVGDEMIVARSVAPGAEIFSPLGLCVMD